jgi:methylthioribose-1-phosphate isomerase
MRYYDNIVYIKNAYLRQFYIKTLFYYTAWNNMNINGKHYRTIWVNVEDNTVIEIIDQRCLPFEFVVEKIDTVDRMINAIKGMHIRGAGAIGAAAGYGMYLASLEAVKTQLPDEYIQRAADKFKAARPTAINLAWAVDRQLSEIKGAVSGDDKIRAALKTANLIADEDVECCKKIGEHGLKLIQQIYKKKKGIVNILTHCNAGWLAFVDYGSALAPVYLAHDNKQKVHVWVDETRPRNQGSRLTAWELSMHGIPHTIIADNTGGHLMQHGMVDIVIVGSDRTTSTGDTANKIGSYLKALAAHDNSIPFYVALPSSTFDWTISDGVSSIPVEQRSSDEILYMKGMHENKFMKIRLAPENSTAVNYAFDITPARLITGLITERGICRADKASILELFPEHKTEGIIKFKNRWIKSDSLSYKKLKDINRWREKLYEAGLIGNYNDGTGYGNISIRTGNNSFIITGSQTGSIKSLKSEHYTEVIDFDIDKNTLVCRGPIEASSESLTHAAAYHASTEINAVIHIHSLKLWERLLYNIPTTNPDAAYGTPEMANEVIKLIHANRYADYKIIAFAGHKEGIIAIGKHLDDAGNTIISQLKQNNGN